MEGGVGGEGRVGWRGGGEEWRGAGWGRGGEERREGGENVIRPEKKFN